MGDGSGKVKQIVLDPTQVHPAVQCPTCQSMLIAKKPPTSTDAKVIVTQCQVCQATIPGKPLSLSILSSLETWSRENIKLVFIETKGKE